MKTGTLRLRQLFVDRILVQASEQRSASGEEPQVLIEPGLLRKSQEEPGVWRVELSLRLGPDLDPPANYLVEMRLFGVFEFEDPELDEQTATRVVAVNGLSMLYTSAREHLWLQTSRGKWGALGLPTASFAGIEIAAGPHQGSGEPAKERAKRVRPKSSKDSSGGE